MKKLMLNKTIFENEEPLNRDQLKKVMGGYGSGGIECLPDCAFTELDCPAGFACVEYEKEGCPPPNSPRRCEPFV